MTERELNELKQEAIELRDQVKVSREVLEKAMGVLSRLEQEWYRAERRYNEAAKAFGEQKP